MSWPLPAKCDGQTRRERLFPRAATTGEYGGSRIFNAIHRRPVAPVLRRGSNSQNAIEVIEARGGIAWPESQPITLRLGIPNGLLP